MSDISWALVIVGVICIGFGVSELRAPRQRTLAVALLVVGTALLVLTVL